MTLRDLRLWHYRKAIMHQRIAESHEQDLHGNKGYNLRRARVNHKAASFHTKAVKALDAVVEGFVEKDNEVPSG
jgi:hypothetical protein